MIPGFPKQMHHPQYVPGQVISNDGRGAVGVDGVGMRIVSGSPARFPPVMVDDPDMEELVRSRGYLAIGEAPRVTDYHEYPLMLQHPDHVDAVPATTGGEMRDGVLVTYPVAPIPEKYPNKVVNSPKEEQEWIEKGWQRPGKADDLAFERQKSAPGMPGSEWPKWVNGVLMQDPDTKAPGPEQYPMYIRLPSGQEVIAKDRADHERLCGPLDDAKPATKAVESAAPDAAEWAEFQAFKAWKAAQATPVAEPEADKETEPTWSVDALRARAKELGIDVDMRWGARRLQRAIDART